MEQEKSFDKVFESEVNGDYALYCVVLKMFTNIELLDYIEYISVKYNYSSIGILRSVKKALLM